MKKALAILLVFVLALGVTGCGSDSKSSSDTKTESTEKTEKSSENIIDDNASYFVKINGKKFSVGDKISSVSKVNLSQDSKMLDKEVNKNTYLIGAGSIYNSDDKRVMSLTVFNASDSKITVKDAVIGGFEAGEVSYKDIKDYVLDLDIEVVGGIKFGSTLEDVEKVFGKTDNVYESQSLGYKTYTYKSKEVYRSYQITIDSEGKVSKIYWQNLVFNR